MPHAGSAGSPWPEGYRGGGGEGGQEKWSAVVVVVVVVAAAVVAAAAAEGIETEGPSQPCQGALCPITTHLAPETLHHSSTAPPQQHRSTTTAALLTFAVSRAYTTLARRLATSSPRLAMATLHPAPSSQEHSHTQPTHQLASHKL